VDLKLFISTFTLISVAELPDKTMFAIILLATRHRPLAVFSGVAVAFVTQNLVALALGNVIGFLPHRLIAISSGILFLFFAYQNWRQNTEVQVEDSSGEAAQLTQTKTFWKSAWLSFMMIFIAEWGDLTQIASAALVAKNPGHEMTIFAASTLALWLVTAIFILIGHHSKKIIKIKSLQRIASIGFAIAGCWILFWAFR